MCICFFFINQKEEGKPRFALYFSREEFQGRKTLPLASFEDHPDIYAGKDLDAQGSWLGFNKKTLKVALLTNRKQKIPVTDKLSRGKLIIDYLNSDLDHFAFHQELYKSLDQYGPCNLLLGDLMTNGFSFSCYYDHTAPFVLQDGFHSMTNVGKFPELLTKQKVGLQIFETEIENYSQDKEFAKKVRDQMKDETQHFDEGIFEKQQQLYMTYFEFNGKMYGSRCNTTLLCHQDLKVFMEEENQDENNTLSSYEF